MVSAAMTRIFAAAPQLARVRLVAARPAAAVVPLRAASSSGSGPITSDLIERMQSKIAAALETDNVVVQDMQGDGRHVAIDVVAAAFEGKNAVNRQRMVYKAIWEELQDTVHAVDAMVTRTPEEAGL